MKKIGTVLALAFLVMSCSNDDDKNKEEFFNLKVGNQWVYKKYYVNNSGENYKGETDTVKIVGTEIIEGKEYFKHTHTNDMFDDASLRVDGAGHLVKSSGRVVHPGTDKGFTDSRPLNFNNDLGTINYALKDMVTVIVEGKSYDMFPYSGYFIPSPQYNLPEGESVIDSYSKGIGFVIKKYRYISGTGFLEWKLVSHDLK
ncbi:hypothetical protein ACX0HA_03880 [Flavobacterium hauense]